MMLFKSSIKALFSGYTDIHDAAANEDLDAIRKILTRDPSCIDTLDPTLSEQKLTPLQMLVLNNCYDGVKLLLEYGAAINKRSTKGLTALIFACIQPTIYTTQEREKMITLLVDNGAQFDLNHPKDVGALNVFKETYPDIHQKFSEKIIAVENVHANTTSTSSTSTVRQRFMVEKKNK